MIWIKCEEGILHTISMCSDKTYDHLYMISVSVLQPPPWGSYNWVCSWDSCTLLIIKSIQSFQHNVCMCAKSAECGLSIFVSELPIKNHHSEWNMLHFHNSGPGNSALLKETNYPQGSGACWHLSFSPAFSSEYNLHFSRLWVLFSNYGWYYLLRVTKHTLRSVFGVPVEVSHCVR